MKEIKIKIYPKVRYYEFGFKNKGDFIIDREKFNELKFESFKEFFIGKFKKLIGKEFVIKDEYIEAICSKWFINRYIQGFFDFQYLDKKDKWRSCDSRQGDINYLNV